MPVASIVFTLLARLGELNQMSTFLRDKDDRTRDLGVRLEIVAGGF